MLLLHYFHGSFILIGVHPCIFENLFSFLLPKPVGQCTLNTQSYTLQFISLSSFSCSTCDSPSGLLLFSSFLSLVPSLHGAIIKKRQKYIDATIYANCLGGTVVMEPYLVRISFFRHARLRCDHSCYSNLCLFNQLPYVSFMMCLASLLGDIWFTQLVH